MDPNKNTTGGKTGVLAFLIRGRKKMKDEYRSSSIDAGANFGFFLIREVDSATRNRPILKKIDVGFKLIIHNSH